MKQKIVRVLNSVLILLVAVFSIGYFAGVGAEKVSAIAPSGFISQTYEDSDGDGMVDQVVIVIDGGEELSACAVTDVEVVADWTYVGNDIGGLLASTGDTHTCDLITATVTLKITGANANTTGHTIAPTIAYNNEDVDDSIANASGSLSAVEAVDIADGAAPFAISAAYKDIDLDEVADRIDVTYSENIEGSTFTEGEWSFPDSDNPHGLAISPPVTFSMTDVLIEVTSSDDSLTIDNTKVKYIAIATATTDGGITDGVNCAIDAELIVGSGEAEDEDEDENEDEDEDYISLPDYGTEKPKQPNPNSGVTLYRVDGDPRVYVIKNKKKHWIKTPKEFKDNNYSWSAVQQVSVEVLGEYSDEETSATELLRAVDNHKVYKLENGKKRWIKTAGEFNAAGYKWKDIKEVSLEALASYQNEVLSELLRAVGDHKVYKLEKGKKRWIKTAVEFNAAGYKWEDIEEVPIDTLDDYPDSE